MKLFNTLSHVFAAAGVLLIILAFAGRFINDRTIFGDLIKGGVTAHSVMIGANSLLLLSIISNSYKKQ
ncbi:MAG: hypothetical protein PHX78_04235 [bacterium]|nr:hypothetical protein [bacterium]